MWRLPIEQHAESHRRCTGRWAHDEMQVAAVESVCDVTVRLAQPDESLLHRPITRERPLIQLQLARDRVRVPLAGGGAPGRAEALRPVRTDVVLSRSQVTP